MQAGNTMSGAGVLAPTLHSLIRVATTSPTTAFLGILVSFKDKTNLNQFKMRANQCKERSRNH